MTGSTFVARLAGACGLVRAQAAAPVFVLDQREMRGQFPRELPLGPPRRQKHFHFCNVACPEDADVERREL